MTDEMKAKVKATLDALLADGKTVLDHFGIDGELITDIEKAHPEVAKLGPMSKRVR